MPVAGSERPAVALASSPAAAALASLGPSLGRPAAEPAVEPSVEPSAEPSAEPGSGDAAGQERDADVRTRLAPRGREQNLEILIRDADLRERVSKKNFLLLGRLRAAPRHLRLEAAIVIQETVGGDFVGLAHGRDERHVQALDEEDGLPPLGVDRYHRSLESFWFQWFWPQCEYTSEHKLLNFVQAPYTVVQNRPSFA